MGILYLESDFEKNIDIKLLYNLTIIFQTKNAKHFNALFHKIIAF
jgi:hypothetical protein